MTADEQQQVITAFVDSCPYHNIRHGTCEDGVGGTICDGDCKYREHFQHEIENIKDGKEETT